MGRGGGGSLGAPTKRRVGREGHRKGIQKKNCMFLEEEFVCIGWGGCECVCQIGGEEQQTERCFLFQSMSYGFHKLRDCLFLTHPHVKLLILHIITVKIKIHQILLWLETCFSSAPVFYLVLVAMRSKRKLSKIYPRIHLFSLQLAS